MFGRGYIHILILLMNVNYNVDVIFEKLKQFINKTTKNRILIIDVLLSF